jgi:hypothetical protein
LLVEYKLSNSSEASTQLFTTLERKDTTCRVGHLSSTTANIIIGCLKSPLALIRICLPWWVDIYKHGSS